jgi:hypothetical protein
MRSSVVSGTLISPLVFNHQHPHDRSDERGDKENASDCYGKGLLLRH